MLDLGAEFTQVSGPPTQQNDYVGVGSTEWVRTSELGLTDSLADEECRDDQHQQPDSPNAVDQLCEGHQEQLTHGR